MGRFYFEDDYVSSSGNDWFIAIILFGCVGYFYLTSYINWQIRRENKLEPNVGFMISDLFLYLIPASIAFLIVALILKAFGLRPSIDGNILVFLILYGALLFFNFKSYANNDISDKIDNALNNSIKLKLPDEERNVKKVFEKNNSAGWYATGFNHSIEEKFSAIKMFTKHYETEHEILGFYNLGLNDGKKYLTELNDLKIKAQSEIDYFLTILQALEWNLLPKKIFKQLEVEYNNSVDIRKHILESGSEHPVFPFEVNSKNENEIRWVMKKIDKILQ
jgi:uncharacterized membrane protein